LSSYLDTGLRCRRLPSSRRRFRSAVIVFGLFLFAAPAAAAVGGERRLSAPSTPAPPSLIAVTALAAATATIAVDRRRHIHRRRCRSSLSSPLPPPTPMSPSILRLLASSAPDSASGTGGDVSIISLVVITLALILLFEVIRRQVGLFASSFCLHFCHLSYITYVMFQLNTTLYLHST
jgi:hypothetical protein